MYMYTPVFTKLIKLRCFLLIFQDYEIASFTKSDSVSLVWNNEGTEARLFLFVMINMKKYIRFPTFQ